jgi:hypothetical protein
MNRIVVLCSVLALVACTSVLGDACTEIGCSNGLVVEFAGEHQPGPWTVEVTAPGETPRTYSCGAGVHCVNPQFANFLPSTVTVRVTGNGKTEEHVNVTPTPRMVRPNGAQCPPECNQPLVTVPFPQP